jgi:chromosome segregation ATPase
MTNKVDELELNQNVLVKTLSKKDEDLVGLKKCITEKTDQLEQLDVDSRDKYRAYENEANNLKQNVEKLKLEDERKEENIKKLEIKCAERENKVRELEIQSAKKDELNATLKGELAEANRRKKIVFENNNKTAPGPHSPHSPTGQRSTDSEGLRARGRSKVLRQKLAPAGRLRFLVTERLKEMGFIDDVVEGERLVVDRPYKDFTYTALRWGAAF